MNLLHICALSDVGCRREENQDAFLVNTMVEKSMLELVLPYSGFYFSYYGLLAAVADGLGGHRGGATASELVLRSLATKVLDLAGRSDFDSAREYLGHYIQHLHHAILEEGQKNHRLSGMGTTLTGVYLHPDFGLFFHAGDSRLYRFRGDFLMQITRDHSPENLSLPLPEQLSVRPQSSIITNCIGGGSAGHCRPDIGNLTLGTGEILLICSDGLSDMLPVEAMEEILGRREGLMAAARDLVDAAKGAGGNDNIALVLVERT